MARSLLRAAFAGALVAAAFAASAFASAADGQRGFPADAVHAAFNARNDADNARRLILPSKSLIPTWMSTEEVLELVKQGEQFADLTETPFLDTLPAAPRTLAYPTAPTHQDEVNKFITAINMTLVEENLTTLSTFFTRYYQSTTGTESANWLFTVMSGIANGRPGVTVNQFVHPNFPQRSIIARIAGQNDSLPAVILGAHQDSINSANPANGRSPGADDDGSGTVSVVEIFRILVEAGFEPVQPVEFHLYAAEEVGLVGSAAIAQSYRTAGTPVYGMLQLDMTAYSNGNPEICVITDFVSDPLTQFCRLLIEEYTNFGWYDEPCGYACSDHASWDRAGYDSAHLFEPQINPRIHLAGDDLNLVNWPQVLEFIKVSIGFAVELSYGENRS